MRLKLADTLVNGLGAGKNAEVIKKAKHIAQWDPFDPQSSANFFDPHWMFGRVLEDGIDIIIGNPPYIGQKGHKELFQEILPTSLGQRFHQRRMDLFYFFFHLALDILKDDGHCSFITTNYFITATYADKLRLDFKNRATILRITNFNELKIFESAAGQHNAVTFLKKGTSSNQIAEIAFTSKTGSANEVILKAIISGEDEETKYRQINQAELYEGNQSYIRMTSNTGSETDPVMLILEKVAQSGTPLGEITKVSQGIVTGADRLKEKYNKRYPDSGFTVGEGIFVLSTEECENKGIPLNSKHVRPWFKNSDIEKYFVNETPSRWVIYYKDEKTKQPIETSILKHFKRFENVLTDRLSVCKKNIFQWNIVSKWINRGEYYLLFYPRKPEIFDEEKIVVPQRSYVNTFGYTYKPWYASADVYFINITNKDIDLKFILALLNSKLYFAWLYYKGKRKGEMMELYQKPLSEIPIKVISRQKQKPFIDLVDKILEKKKSNLKSDTANLETEIDKLAYSLYSLSPNEIKDILDALPKERHRGITDFESE